MLEQTQKPSLYVNILQVIALHSENCFGQKSFTEA